MHDFSIDPDHVGYSVKQLRDTADRAEAHAAAPDTYPSVRVSQRTYAQACRVQAHLLDALGMQTVPDVQHLAEDDDEGNRFVRLLLMLDGPAFTRDYDQHPLEAEDEHLSAHLAYVATMAGVRAREAARNGDDVGSAVEAGTWAQTAREAIDASLKLRMLEPQPDPGPSLDPELVREVEQLRDVVGSHESAFVLLRRMHGLFEDAAPGTIGVRLQRQIAAVLDEAGEQQGPEGDGQPE